MCGRFAITLSEEELADVFGTTADLHLVPRYNIAPSQAVPVVRNRRSGGRELVRMRWGLIPHWNTDPKHPGFVNARAETAPSKPAFRDPFRWRRCLVPADGFYEWKAVGKKHKQPFFFRQAGGGVLAFAGLWDTWVGPDGPVESVAVLTTAANELVRPLHDRMPAVIPAGQFGLWLDPKEHRAENLLPLLVPYPADLMESWPVSEKVNSAAVEEPGLNAPEAPKVTWTQPTLFDVA
jgi:putative SOS response-associated peptidase YedK